MSQRGHYETHCGDLIKILWHDGLGMSLYAKRLERGRFLWPSPADGVVSITPAQLAYLLDGIEMALARPLRAGGTRSTPSGRSGPVDVGVR